MLVLSRRRGEQITLRVKTQSETVEIVITAVEVRGDKMRIGITADLNVEIIRNELLNGWRGNET